MISAASLPAGLDSLPSCYRGLRRDGREREPLGDERPRAASLPKGVARLDRGMWSATAIRSAMRCSTGSSGACCNGERDLLEVASDPLVHRLDLMARAVRRDLHKMHAFVRFRRMHGRGLERFAAWFEPEHFILEAAAPFFVDRFRSMDWTILTPIGSVRWDREALTFGPPGTARGCARRGQLRGGLARLLRERVQPGAGEPRPPCAPRCRRSTGATCRRPRRFPA